MRLVEYRHRFGWSQDELARRADLDDNTVRKAERGEPVTGRTARALLRAIAAELGQPITLQQIEGLQVKVWEQPQRKRTTPSPPADADRQG